MQVIQGKRSRAAAAVIILTALVLTGCRADLRRLLDRLDLTPVAVVTPPAHQVEAPGADQPVVRPAGLFDSLPEQEATAVRRRRHAPLALASIGPFEPAASGPGLVVGEPAAGGGQTTLAAFGAGCGRWLQFTLGGLGELGKTPAWSDLDRARRELGRPDLRWTVPDAMRLAGCLGVTHVAVGSITGSMSRCTLTYQLYAVPSGRRQGNPVRVAGSPAQIAAALPDAARALAARVGLRAPGIPARAGASAAELRQIGALPWVPGTAVSAAQRRQLQELARRLPLAGLLYFNSGAMREERRVDETIRTLVRQAPDHPLVFGEIARWAPAKLGALRGRLDRNLQRFPNQQLFVLAGVKYFRSTGLSREEAAMAGHLVCCAPRDPDAWLTLAWTISLTSEQLRQGRYYSRLSPTERIQLEQIYPRWLRAAEQAAQLDPRDGTAWLRVATAACFAGERRVAETAYNHALALNPGDVDTYTWGLQMYQWKWLNDPTNLDAVAEIAAAERYPYAWQAVAMAAALDEIGADDLSRRLIDRTTAENQALLRRQPRNAQAHYDRAILLKNQGRRRAATEEFRVVARLRPEDAAAHFDLGLILDDRHRTDEAIPEYREALRLDPDNRRVRYDLAYALKSRGQVVAAEKMFREALRLRPSFPDAHYGLGELYFATHRLGAAARQYRLAIAFDPDAALAYQQLCAVLARQGQYGAAIQAGQRAVQLIPQSIEAHDALAYAYAMNHQTKNAERECREAIRIYPSDALAHENRGDMLIEMGRKQEARAEWQRVLLLDHGASAQEARQMLARYP